MNGCLGSILSFFLFLIVIALLYKSGIFNYMFPVFLSLLDLLSAVIKGLTGVVINGYTPPDFNQLYNIY